MSYMSTGINNSPTIVDKAGAALSNGAFKLMKRDAGGKFVIASVAGERVVGVAIASTPVSVATNDDLTVQIKDIGYVKAGDAVAKGAEITTDTSGRAVTATNGAFIVGEALTAAGAADDIIQVQITKAGYKAGGEVTPLTLAGLADVDLTEPAEGDRLTFNGEKWVNDTVALDDLTDVTLTEAAAGETLVYDGEDTWENQAMELSDLADVDDDLTPVDGDTLEYDGTVDNEWKTKTTE